jgi:hypothetical protein
MHIYIYKYIHIYFTYLVGYRRPFSGLHFRTFYVATLQRKITSNYTCESDSMSINM